jgi:hypothetical protein
LQQRFAALGPGELRKSLLSTGQVTRLQAGKEKLGALVAFLAIGQVSA